MASVPHVGASSCATSCVSKLRNFFYVGDTPSDSTIRFRNRLELLVALNKDRFDDDRVRYLIADWEWLIPIDDPDERFASRQRIRAGLGYRRSFNWRYEVLYIWTRSRNTIDEVGLSGGHSPPSVAALTACCEGCWSPGPMTSVSRPGSPGHSGSLLASRASP
jgi:hypothetical protein